MGSSKQADGAGDLAKEVGHWLRTEEENRELKNRVASALDEVNAFIAERRADLGRRKGRLLQTSGFRDETRAMETALAAIQQLLADRRNISRIFSEIDAYLGTFNVDDTLSRLHTRTQLADARDEFMCAFHDSIRGTRLSELLNILYFMPFAFWRSRGFDRRNYRSPSAGELDRLLADFGRQGIDCNRTDPVHLAAIIRIQLGITPRMDYHNMPGNKLAERLTAGETLTRFTAQAMPLDDGFFRTAGGILGNLRRWSAEFLGDAGLPVPAEIEAEMLQIVFLAADTIRISGTERERSTDYLWLLATVIASDHATLKDVLTWPAVKNTRYPAVYERILAAKTYLATVAALGDPVLAVRFSEAKAELAALTRRSEAIAAQDAHDYAAFTELEQLRERRSDLGKSLIKIAESLQLIEPALLDVLANPGGISGPPSIAEHLRSLDPAALIERNRANAEEAKVIARQELEKLRVLIGRIAAISRQGFATGASREAVERQQSKDNAARRSAAGVEIGALSAAAVRARLLESLRKAAVSVRDARSRLEGARKRQLKSDLLHTLNVLSEKTRKAADSLDSFEAAADAAALAPAAAEALAPSLREIMTALTNFNARLNNAKLPPAEKQPLTTMCHAIKAKLSDDLRDVECLRAELAERSAAAVPAQGATAPAAGVMKIAALVAAANAALGPVKEQLLLLGTALADPRRETLTILGDLRGLKDAATRARELMSGKLALIASTAAGCAVSSDEYVDKFDRWLRQLAAVDTETDRLTSVVERLAASERAVKTAVALERAVSAACASPAGEAAPEGELLEARERCAEALATLAASLSRVQEAREACAAATGAQWRLLKAASGYLGSSGARLDAGEAALGESRSRLERLNTVLFPDGSGGPKTRS